jgi:mannose-6-phosphate isomerase-like protein (cupin superfamily)
LTKRINFYKYADSVIGNFFRGVSMSRSGKVVVIELNDRSEYQRLLAGEPQTCGMRSGRVYLGGGDSCGQHSTENREEMLIFLCGEGELLIGEEDCLEVGEGKVAYIPPNTVHNVKNTGSKPLIYVYCVASVNSQEGKKGDKPAG